MANINQLKEVIAESESVKLVTQALGELAALDLQNTRSEVLQNTIFFNELAEVYHQVRVVAARRQLLTKHTIATPKNGKTVSILLTSNAGFFGGLDNKITQNFIETTKQYPTDRVVVGKFGINYLKESNFNAQFQPILFAKDMPSPEELKRLVDASISYSRILLFHAKFVTTLHQEAEISDISQTGSEEEAKSSQFDYILEPELQKMLLFFENQMLTLLFKAIFLQSQLSKTAARMVSMYEAELNVEKQIGEERRSLLQAQRDRQNVLILETYAGLLNLLSYLDE